MIAFIMRFLLGIIFLAVLPGAAGACWQALLGGGHFTWWPLLGGLVAGSALYFVLLRRIPGFEVFEHELTHALIAWLYLRRVTNFTVRRNNGHILFDRGFGGIFGDDMIGFAPYVLPTFTAVLILIRPLLGGTPLGWYDFWIGATFGYHVWSGHRELSPRQPDLATRGLLYSLIAVPTLALITHGLLLTILLHGYGGVPAWAGDAWRSSVQVVRMVLGKM